MDRSILWTLTGLQLAMGTFDTLFHNKGTERLVWRKSQKTERRPAPAALPKSFA